MEILVINCLPSWLNAGIIVGTECVERVMGDSCTVDSQCSYNVTNSECSGGVCSCKAGWVAIKVIIVIKVIKLSSISLNFWSCNKFCHEKYKWYQQIILSMQR